MLKRFLAQVIDFVIVIFLCQLVFTLFGKPDWGRYYQMQDAVAGMAANAPIVVQRASLYQECFIITLIIAVVYEAMLTVIFGGSLGKLIFGFRVVSVNEDRGLFVSKLLLAARSLIKALSIYLISAIPFVLMCLTAFGNAENRSDFDIFVGAKTINVRREK